MNFNALMNKIRQFDNRSSRWLHSHFYILIFQIILFFILGAIFINGLKIIDINIDVQKSTIVERLLMSQTINTLLISILLLFNSFWILYILGSLLRLRTVLKNIDFNLSRRRGDQRNKDI